MFTCVGLQNMLHDWDVESGNLNSWTVELEVNGNMEDEGDDSPDEERRFWCAPKLRRSDKIGDTFVPGPQVSGWDGSRGERVPLVRTANVNATATANASAVRTANASVTANASAVRTANANERERERERDRKRERKRECER